MTVVVMRGGDQDPNTQREERRTRRRQPMISQGESGPADFPGSPVVMNLPSNATTRFTPGWGTKIPPASRESKSMCFKY